MESQQHAPTLDELFQGMPTANSQPGPKPKYGEYSQKFRNMAQKHKPRMIVPAILIVAVMLLFGGVGVYMVRTWNNIPEMPMSAAQAFEGIQSAQEFVPDPRRIYTATGQAVAYGPEWYYPTGNTYGNVIDITDWLSEMDRLTIEQKSRYSINNGGCKIWQPNK